MIKMKNVNKNYDDLSLPVLQNIDLEIQTGEIFGLIGKSGAGKSTLLRCINLLEQPNSGEIFIDGEEITVLAKNKALKHIRRQVGMIFQQFHLLYAKTVYQNVALGLEIHGYPKKEIAAIVMQWLDEVDLADKARVYPAQLSGGQKQRVAIARALAMHPKILLCDEATSALDPETTFSILQLLRKLQRQHQLTLVLVAHQMEVIKNLCDRVAVLDQGRIQEISALEQFFLKPQSEAGRALAAAAIRENLPENTQILPLAAAGEQEILLRIFFQGEKTGQPVISTLIREVAINMNILQANIEHVRQNPLGIMIVQMAGTSEAIQQALQFFQQRAIVVEVLA